jgi:hypothetical protein
MEEGILNIVCYKLNNIIYNLRTNQESLNERVANTRHTNISFRNTCLLMGKAVPDYPRSTVVGRIQYWEFQEVIMNAETEAVEN